MACNTYNLEINQGATFVLDFIVSDQNDDGTDTPWNLTGYTARSQGRYLIDDDGTFFDASTANGKIVIIPLLGQVTMTLPEADTLAMTAPTINAVWDMELIDGSGNVTRILEGKVTISPEVTR